MMTESPESELIQEYEGIVKAIAASAHFSSPILSIEDLIQIGNIAVLRAVKSYDPSCGANIKSFVYRLVKQDVYKEAARFIGVFTVDHRNTKMAKAVCDCYERGMSDEKVVEFINDKFKKKYKISDIDKLRFLYDNKNTRLDAFNEQDIGLDSFMLMMDEVFTESVDNETELYILKNRILGNLTAIEAADNLSISVKKLYSIESNLRKNIIDVIGKLFNE